MAAPASRHRKACILISQKSSIHFKAFSPKGLIQVTHGLALGEEADFEALNCQSRTKADARQDVPIILNPLLHIAFVMLSGFFIISI